MSALIPPSQKARKLGLPSPRLDIPPKGTAAASSSSSDDTESAGPGAAAIGLPFHNGGSNISSSSTNGVSYGQPPLASSSSVRAGPPKLSLPSLSSATRTGNQTSDPSAATTGSSLSVAAGFENMSLEEDKTMRPGLVQVAPLPMLAPIARPSAGKPKLGLTAVGASRTASPARQPHPSLPAMPARQVSTDHYASVPSTSADHTAMTRTTSFEGALMAETNSAIIGDQEYKLSPSTLEDLGHLGEGASGEVRKTLHKPSGVIMAVKVRGSTSLHSSVSADRTASLTDHSRIVGRRRTETDLARISVQSRNKGRLHCAILWCLLGGCKIWRPLCINHAEHTVGRATAKSRFAWSTARVAVWMRYTSKSGGGKGGQERKC